MEGFVDELSHLAIREGIFSCLLVAIVRKSERS